MFFSLRLRAKKEEKRSRKSAKWSLDKAFCPGVSEKLKDTPTENGRTLEELHERIPEESVYNDDVKLTRVVGVALERDSSGLGITLRSGPPNPAGHRPLLITKLKSNGPADREGTIKVGDRLLGIDGQRLTGLSLPEAERLLVAPNGGRPVWLSVEYDVSVMTSLRTSGPLLVEVESPEGRTDLGLSLMDSLSGVIVASVKTASIAERCGAFLPGDQILALNEYRLEYSRAAEVQRLLDTINTTLIQIEILPVATVCKGQSNNFLTSSLGNISQQYQQDRDNMDNTYLLDKNLMDEDTPELRIESGIVTLHTTPEEGFGVVFRSAPSKKGAVICYMEPHGIADRSGVLQIGDRVLSVNGRQADRFDKLEDLGTTTVVLTVQFDVEVHTFSEGHLPVTLTKSDGSGFGITISGSGGEYEEGEGGVGVVISHIKWGSVAHRSGRLSAGDQLVGINGLDIRSDLPTAMEIFKLSGPTVTFIVNKTSLDLGYSSPGLPSVDSAVESWDSSELQSPQHEYSHQEYRDTWQTETNESTNSLISQQSDEETVSSLRLSESVLDALTAGRQNMRKPPSPPCPLQTNYRLRKINLPTHWRGSSSINNSSGLTNMDIEEVKNSPKTFKTFRGSTKCEENVQMSKEMPKTVFQVTLYKNMVFEDFGFSVSDGLYEKGVFVNTIKPGSPADLCKKLRPYDKIIQVNDVPTHDLDCCMTVPLMATAGEKLTLTIVRYGEEHSFTNGTENCQSGWAEVHQESTENITKRYETL